MPKNPASEAGPQHRDFEAGLREVVTKEDAEKYFVIRAEDRLQSTPTTPP
jgi:hypothetical protein